MNPPHSGHFIELQGSPRSCSVLKPHLGHMQYLDPNFKAP
jgi:hypothetical protein